MRSGVFASASTHRRRLSCSGAEPRRSRPHRDRRAV